jgi:hypothetical protein
LLRQVPIQSSATINENWKPNLFAVPPGRYEITSLIAACFAGIIWPLAVVGFFLVMCMEFALVLRLSLA